MENIPLFETKRFKGKGLYRIFATSVFVGICFIWYFRFSRIPKYSNNNNNNGKYWAWIGLVGAEIWFGLYWILTQALRWNKVYRLTFKDRLSQRYEKELPRVDVFVCTADPKIEPPMMVINTVLSVMSYDYPPEKLAVYLSDDGGSDLTFYALSEAAEFAKHWIPFCNKFDIEPRSPAAYFRSIMSKDSTKNSSLDNDCLVKIKKFYMDMENRIDNVTNLGKVPKDKRSKYEDFTQWDSFSSSRDHETILRILIDGRDSKSIDVDGRPLPTLVYLAREKRPEHFHNFKAGAMNALIRVSSKISKGKVILNVDCDMYSNNSKAIRDALCFFLDKENGREIAFVQFPQNFENITKNDLYAGSLRVINEIEFHGVDGYGGPLYVGSGCFHQRDILSGEKLFGTKNNNKFEEKTLANDNIISSSVYDLEETSKLLASCTYEKDTQWGKKIGLKYGCPVEDVITGLSIQCQGWKSVYMNPSRKAFLGVAPTTLSQTLVQHKRWSEGDLQIFLSKYSPAWFGFNKISFGHQLGYCVYCLWAPNCLAILYYSIVPSLCLLKGIPLFPHISSLWFIPFAYVIIASYTQSLSEFLWSKGTLFGWFNDQRMWLYKRSSSYLFAFIETLMKRLGFSSQTAFFVVTSKVTDDDDVADRYENDVMEFGASSPMFAVLSSVALLNLFCLFGAVAREILAGKNVDGKMFMQYVICGVLVLINWPLYKGLFVRKDKGKMEGYLGVKSAGFAIFACACVAYY